ncbi:metallophosphoesterase family protein [Brucellaceae bacterium C25G]
MFRLAHISDIHLSPLPAVSYRDLASKRITGYVNWMRNRKNALEGSVLDDLMNDLKKQNPDHIALTGDLVNLALNAEIDIARAWLEKQAAPDDLSVVPGNHDAYVPGALRKACKSWEPWMRGDGINNNGKAPQFPYLRQRGNIAIIGVSSARATAPFMASGDFLPAQAHRLALMLERAKQAGLCRVVMIHHPPVRGATPNYKRLFGIARFQKIIKNYGAELVLHGHTHLATHYEIEGTNGATVPVICVPSASQSFGAHKPPARFNLFDISKQKHGWACEWSQRGILHEDNQITEIGTHQLILPDY